MARAHGGDVPFAPPGRARAGRHPDGPRHRPRAHHGGGDGGDELRRGAPPRPHQPGTRPAPARGGRRPAVGGPRPRRRRQRVGAELPPGVGRRAAGRPDPEPLLRHRHGVTRRQDTARYLRINGNFYVWRAASARAPQQSWFDEGRYAGVEIPEAQAFSIDDEYEFRLIEALVAAGLVQLPWTRTADGAGLSPGERRSSPAVPGPLGAALSQALATAGRPGRRRRPCGRGRRSADTPRRAGTSASPPT